MQVRDYMTKAVFSLRDDRGLVGAREIMNWAHVRHVPVVDAEKRVVGVLSHRDLVRASAAPTGRKNPELGVHEDVWQVPVTRVMSRTVQTIGPDAHIAEAARAMRHGRLGCLPVVDEDEVLIGIITEHDLLRLVEDLVQ